MKKNKIKNLEIVVFWGCAAIFFGLFIPLDGYAGGVIAGPGYSNPLTVNSFTEWLGNLLASIQGIVGWLAVIMIMIGGILYITSGGRQSQATLAKTIILFAMIGFALAVAAPSLLREIRDIAAGSTGGGNANLISQAKPIHDIVEDVMNFALVVIGSLAVIGFVTGGIMYIMAAGDTKRADTGKKIVIYSIIAIAVSGAGIIILRQVMAILSTSA